MQIFICRDGAQVGPFSELQIREQLAQGSLLPTDLAWHEGLPEWVQLGGIVEPSNKAVPESTPEGLVKESVIGGEAAFPRILSNERVMEHRIVALDLFKLFTQDCQTWGKSVPDPLAESHKNLLNNRFLLAVVGKVKAGKSTFINALLGSDLLPSDALQATAAIIEIRHAKQASVSVTYANGRTETVCPENGRSLTPIANKLRQVAAIRDEYRDLPIAQLNDFLISRYNPDKKEAAWEDNELDFFLNSDLPNIHKLNSQTFRDRNEEYLNQHRNGNEVAKEIHVHYPHDFPFDNFIIVDTPGLCAKGGIEERTLQFMKQADGVIYLNKDEPSETSLHNAWDNIIPEKTKNHFILVFTHKSNRTKRDNEKYLKEAREIFSQVPAERIFNVDSLTENVLEAIYKTDKKDWDDIKGIRNQNDEWKKVTADAWVDSDGDVHKLLNLLEEQSNMRTLKREILLMSEKSMAIQISTVLDYLREQYSEMEEDAEQQLTDYRSKLKDPQTFNKRADELREQMESMKTAMADKIPPVIRKFNLDSDEKEFGAELKRILDFALSEINGKEFKSEEPAKTADAFLEKLDCDFQNELEQLAIRFKQALGKELSDVEEALRGDFDISVPKVPLKTLLDEAKVQATETVRETRQKTDWFSRVLQFFHLGGKEEVEVNKFNAPRYFSSAKSVYIKALNGAKASFAKSGLSYVEASCESYKNAFSKKIDERNDRLKKLQDEKTQNQVVQDQADEMTQSIEEFKKKIIRCEIEKGSLCL